MISIDNTDHRLDAICDEYYKEVKIYFKIKENVTGSKTKKDKLQNLFFDKRNKEAKMIQFLRENLKEIIYCTPSELQTLHQKFIDEIKINLKDRQHLKHFTSFKERMEAYYSRLFAKQKAKSDNETTVGRWLSNSINMKVCPYCNHNYTLTVNNKATGVNFRPDFDHFLPKSSHPLLALSFFNLIPSCTVCNKLKGSKQIALSPHNLTTKNAITFKCYGINDDNEEVLLGLGDKYKRIIIRPKSSEIFDDKICNIKNLGMQDVYNNQIDYVQEIIDKAQEYNKDSYKGMIDSFKGLGKTEAEIDRIIWSAYLDEQAKRPLSKLTNDVLVQLGIKSGD